LKKFKAVCVSPATSGRIENPDFIWMFGDSAQMCLLLNAMQWKDYERFKFSFTGEGSCADAFVEAYYTGKPQLSVPCMGERLMGIVKDDEMEIVLPIDYLQKAADGLKALNSARTIGYPIPIYGYQMDIVPLLSQTYPDMENIRKRVMGD
jgi:uncharacterized protein (DUF169 family)